MSLNRFFVGGCAVALLSSCSFLGLDNLPRRACNADDNVCAPLNGDGGLASSNPCLSWQCAPSNFCELLPVDADGDGDSPPTCAATVTTDGGGRYSFTDCDDTNAMRRGHVPTATGFDDATEECGDAVDNDCNGTVDDMSSSVISDAVASFTSPGQIRFGRSEGSPPIALAVAPPESGAQGLQIARVTLGGSEDTVVVSNLSASSSAPDIVNGGVRESVAVASIGGDRFAVAYAIQAASPLAALCSGGDVGTGPFVLVEGITGGNAPMTPGRCIPIGRRFATPAMAAERDGSDVLLVWVDDVSSRACSTATDANVLARRVRLSNATEQLSPVLTLGMTSAGSAPAVRFVQGRGWVVFYVDQDGAVAAAQVSNPNGLADTAVSSLGVVLDAPGPITQVTANTGDLSETIALTTTFGGCVAAQTGLAVDVVDFSGGTLGAARVIEDMQTGRRSGAVSAFLEDGASSQWLVAYQTNSAIEILRFSDPDPMSDVLAVRMQEAQTLVSTRASFDAIILQATTDVDQAPVVAWLAQNGSELASGDYSCR